MSSGDLDDLLVEREEYNSKEGIRHTRKLTMAILGFYFLTLAVDITCLVISKPNDPKGWSYIFIPIGIVPLSSLRHPSPLYSPSAS